MTGQNQSRTRRTPVVLCCAGLLWMFGCGGDDGGSTPPPDPPPDMAGIWSGTETVTGPGGSCGSNGAGTRTGDIFNVTQNGNNIELLQLSNCFVCQFSGTISATGAFDVRGTNPPVTVRLQGQVTGNSLTATKRPIGGDCNLVAEYDLTHP